MRKLIYCDLCGTKYFKFLFNTCDKSYDIKGRYFLNQCKNCGLIFINPQPNKKEILKHYPSDKYYSFTNSLSNYSWLSDQLYKLSYSKNSNFWLKLLFLPIKPLFRSTRIVSNGRFLDVGCGQGNFLLLMKKFDMDCYGVEPGEFDKSFAKRHNLNIFKGSLKQANYHSNYFDVITLNHVFEHVYNPTETLKELHRILKPKGYLIIAVPQSNCLFYKLFGEYWSGLDVPRHLFTYSTSVLKKYAEKTGFRLEKVKYTEYPWNFLSSFLYWTNKYKKKQYLEGNKFIGGWLQFLLRIPLSYIFNFLRIGGDVEIILRK